MGAAVKHRLGTCYQSECWQRIEQGEVFCRDHAELVPPGLLAHVRSLWVVNQSHDGTNRPGWHEALTACQRFVEKEAGDEDTSAAEDG
jgi:hypothetical protein